MRAAAREVGWCEAPGCLSVPLSSGYCRAHQRIRALLEPKTFKVTAPRTQFFITPINPLIDWAPRAEDATYTYAIGVHGAVKIGRGDPAARLQMLQIGNHRRLRLLGKILSSSNLEPSLHWLLKDYCLRGEWFKMTGLVRDVVRAIRNQDLDEVRKIFGS